jgi:hypothetical protein
LLQSGAKADRSILSAPCPCGIEIMPAARLPMQFGLDNLHGATIFQRPGVTMFWG